MSTDENARELDDKAPVLGSWRNIYLFVTGTLVVCVVIFTLITRACA